MRRDKVLNIFLVFILSFMMLTSITYSEELPKNIKITIEDNVIDKVGYKGYYLQANKIIIDNTENVCYCLEIDKEYPKGEDFILKDSNEYNVNAVLQVGYPNLSPEEIGVTTKEEAYFSTQIALWCYLEGYDANFITGDNMREVQAIKKIYNEAIAEISNTMKYKVSEYFTNEEVQDIVVLSVSDNSTSEEINEIYNGK